MEMSAQCHAPAALPTRKEIPVLVVPAPVWMWWGREKFLPLLEMKLFIIHPIECHFTD